MRVSADLRLETLLPEEEPHDLRYFRAGRTHILRKRTSQSRRFSLVSAGDVVITIGGAGGTRGVLDLALAIERPVLPIPFTGRQSRLYWERHRDQIETWFGRRENGLLDDLEQASLHERGSVELVTRLVLGGLRRKCFVMMPFAKDRLGLFREVICPTLDALGVLPVRTDQLSLTGSAIDTLRNAIRSCDAALADISGLNPNVLYELGLAHAQDKPVVIICQSGDQGDLPDLPFDLSAEHVIPYRDGSWDALGQNLLEALTPLLGENQSRIVRPSAT